MNRLDKMIGGAVRLAALVFVVLGLFGAAVEGTSARSTATSQQSRPTGTAGVLEVLARVTPTDGRAEPAREFMLYLLRKSFADIQREAEEIEPRPDMDKFIDGLDV